MSRRYCDTLTPLLFVVTFRVNVVSSETIRSEWRLDYLCGSDLPSQWRNFVRWWHLRLWSLVLLVLFVVLGFVYVVGHSQRSSWTLLSLRRSQQPNYFQSWVQPIHHSAPCYNQAGITLLFMSNQRCWLHTHSSLMKYSCIHLWLNSALLESSFHARLKQTYKMVIALWPILANSSCLTRMWLFLLIVSDFLVQSANIKDFDILYFTCF